MDSSASKNFELTAAVLHIIAMTLMLMDHLWATLLPAKEWLTCAGRVAFPIFAFMAVEGYFHTRSFKKYILRMLLFAVLSEIPFDLMYGGTWFYPVHQNVLWTFLLSLLGVWLMEQVRKKGKTWMYLLVCVLVVLAGLVLGTLCMVDYYGAGVLTNHAADVLLILIHHTDGGCRSHIDQNERHRIPVDSRDGTDDQIGTDGGRIVHQHFQTDIHIHIDDQRFLPRHLADRLPHQGCNRRYYRTDDRAGDLTYLDFPQLQHHFQGNRIVKLCFPTVCRHPLGKEDFPIRNTTENHIRISDIQCQNHTVLPPAFFQSRYKFCPVKCCADCTGEDCGRYHLAYCIDSYETTYEQDDIFSADQPLHIFGIAKQND